MPLLKKLFSRNYINLFRCDFGMSSRYARLERVFGDNELVKSKVVSVIGLGALGSHVASLLVRSGVHVRLFDHDIVSVENLSSQTLYTSSSVGKLKALVARDELERINEEVLVNTFAMEVTEENVEDITADVVVDCTDNMRTRFILNVFCKKNNIPLVHGAAIGEKGTVFVVQGACLSCVYGERDSLATCSSEGITNVIASMVAALQVEQVLNILYARPIESKLLRVDAKNGTIIATVVEKDPECVVCQNSSNKESRFKIRECTERGGWSVKPNISHVDLHKVVAAFPVVKQTDIAVVVKVKGHEVLVHEHGEMIVKEDLPLKELEQIGVLVLACQE